MTDTAEGDEEGKSHSEDNDGEKNQPALQKTAQTYSCHCSSPVVINISSYTTSKNLMSTRPYISGTSTISLNKGNLKKKIIKQY